MTEKKRAPVRNVAAGQKPQPQAAPYVPASERPRPHAPSKAAPGGYGVKPKE